MRTAAYGELRMVHPSDNRLIQNGDALVDGLARIIQYCPEVRIRTETKACYARLGTIGNKEGPIR